MEEEQGESSSSTCVTEESVSEELKHPWPYLASLFKFIAKAGNTYRFRCLLLYVKRKRRKGCVCVRRTWIPLQISKKNTMSVCIRRMSPSTMNLSRDPASERRTTSLRQWTECKETTLRTTTHCQIFPKRTFCHTSDSQQGHFEFSYRSITSSAYRGSTGV